MVVDIVGLNLLLVAMGGSIGCASRYAISVGMAAWFGAVFPLGTLLVNVVGCFLIGCVGQWYVSHPALSDAWRLAIAFGFLGGLTTFSSFGLETYLFLSEGRYGSALGYIVLSNFLGIAAVAVGFSLTKVLLTDT